MAQQEHALKQRTLFQQVQMDETKMAAQHALEMFKTDNAKQSRYG